METAIAFAAGMLLTLIALALEDWTRLGKRRSATLPNEEEEFVAARMFVLTSERDPAASGQESRAATPRLERVGRRPAA
jgi:hypothetical protein